MNKNIKKIIFIIIIVLLIIVIMNHEISFNLFYTVKEFIGFSNKCKVYNNKYQICTVKNHKYVINPLDSIVSFPLKRGNYWESFLHKYFNQYSNKEMNCLDIGANIGTHIVILGGLFKNVYAFEPQKDVFEILSLNIKENNLKNITAYNFGLGNIEKKANMWFIDKNKSNNFGRVGIIEDDENKKEKGESINIKTLDSLNLKNIAFIKIDVEGYEYNALLGGIKTIKKYKPTIIFEQHDSNSPLFKFLEELGYKIRRISILNDYIAIQ